jgi:flagellar motility protein MotE (MotC chaperone)
MKLLRDYRLVPMVLIATGALLVLKATGLLLDGGYSLGQRLNRGEALVVTTVPLTPTPQLRSPSTPLEPPPGAPRQRSWMQEMFNYPDATGTVNAPRASQDAVIITGAAGAAKPAPKPEAKPEPAAPPEAKPAAPAPAASAPATNPAAAPGAIDPSRPASAAERAILERLHQRRQELEARARELEIRESLVKAAEKKLEERLEEIKQTEARINASMNKRDEAEAARFKGIVTMYETMKPRDAAKIFDRLDLRVLLEVASLINPRRMSEIMAQMSPEAAERLTVELASRNGDKPQNPADLPKIDGKPGGT